MWLVIDINKNDELIPCKFYHFQLVYNLTTVVNGQIYEINVNEQIIPRKKKDLRGWQGKELTAGNN